ncbi:DUF3267 domain-containing protein [Pedobacter deserti]|uniref:DUF3267 domain-containing protein n=1 Tax=Pedobacter deserti TaxID=2817382 RepID=UPI00210F03DA|nr:DUF3267 domain-containing protein [Pedobacter sp. SYSU D00382]
MKTADQDQARELTISAGQAQLKSIAYFLPFAFVFVLVFYLLWPNQLSLAHYKEILPPGVQGLVWLVGIMLAGIVVHELIHGLAWALFASSGFRTIRFGILWKSLTPYCHCTEPLRLRHYQIGAAAPGIILGIIPTLIAILTGSISWLAFGLFFTLAAGGDLLIILMLRNESKQSFIQDHPNKIGCLVYKKP